MHFSLRVLSCGNQCLVRTLSIRCFTCPEYLQVSDLLLPRRRARTTRALARDDANEPLHQSFHSCPWISWSTDYCRHTARWRSLVREALVWICSYRFWSYVATRAQLIVGSLQPVGSSMFIDEILLQSLIYALKQATCSSVLKLEMCCSGMPL